MKKGRLSKPELKRLARAWSDLDAMVAQIPMGTKDRDEECTWNALIEARNRMGEILRWQDVELATETHAAAQQRRRAEGLTYDEKALTAFEGRAR